MPRIGTPYGPCLCRPRPEGLKTPDAAPARRPYVDAGQGSGEVVPPVRQGTFPPGGPPSPSTGRLVEGAYRPPGPPGAVLSPLDARGLKEDVVASHADVILPHAAKGRRMSRQGDGLRPVPA